MFGSILTLYRKLRFPGLATPPPVSAPGTCELYFDGTDLQMSENAGAWAPIASTPSAGGWTDDGVVVRLTTASDQVAIGAAAPTGAEKLYLLGDLFIDHSSPLGALGVNIDPALVAGARATAGIVQTQDDGAPVDLLLQYSKSGAGAVTDCAVVSSGAVFTGSGSVDDFRHFEAKTTMGGGDAVDNAYGLYVHDQAAGLAVTNGYGLWLDGTADLNVARGIVIIGATAQSSLADEQLYVVGDQRNQGDLKFEEGASRSISVDARTAAAAGNSLSIFAAKGGDAVVVPFTGGTTSVSGGEGGDGDGAVVAAGAGGPLGLAGGDAGTDTGGGGANGGDLLANGGGASGAGTTGGNAFVDGGPGPTGGSVFIGRTVAEKVEMGRSGKDIELTAASLTINGKEIAPFTDAGVKVGAYNAVIDDLVRVDPSGGAFIVTLPTAAGLAMRAITVKEVAGSATAVTINTTGIETIDGAASDSIAAAYGAATYVSDGTNWMKFT